MAAMTDAFTAMINDQNSKVLIIATRNANKLKEILSMLSEKYTVATRADTSKPKPNFVLLTLDDLEEYLRLPKGTIGDCNEVGVTYEENARLKIRDAAQYISGKSNFALVAEDSGLELVGINWAVGSSMKDGENDRLAGRPFPGVDTAPFVKSFGNKDSLDNTRQALEFYQSCNPSFIKAVSVLALAFGDGSIQTFRGELMGTLALPMRQGIDPKTGKAYGFDYDFGFQPVGELRTLSEMLEEKNTISHRRRAFDMTAKYLMAL